MKKSIGLLFLGLVVIGVLPMAGCSNNFVMPWESNTLDPSRIPTREPLEVPPDMDTLPGKEPPEESQLRGRSSKDVKEDVPTSASTILFKTPQIPEEKPLTREEKERLPNWLGRSPGSK